jgi:hypothetical protein
MRQGFFYLLNELDTNDNPSGGVVTGNGLVISWQNGPLGRGAERLQPNGAFVEDVIAAALQRIEFYQTAANGKFRCDENEIACTHLRAALNELALRTARREARGVEGTHQQ